MRSSRNKRHGSEMPHVDLVPIMDMILTILTFFIFASLSLSRQQGVINVTLLITDSGVTEQTILDP